MPEAVQREMELEGADLVEMPYRLPLELTVEDSETIRALCDYPDGEARERFALAALKIGVLALRQAQGQIDGAAVGREMDRMIGNLKVRLTEHAQHVREHLGTTLREYFDPESGRFQERIRRLIRNDGELEQLLRRQIGCEDSELAKTLLRHVGEHSPLFKMLDPEQSDGLLASLRGSLDEQLTVQRRQILDQFSLDNKDGALTRLVGELKENHGELNTALQKRIDEVVKEFSFDDENSALSRLVQNVAAAQKTITSEFSLDNKESALARLKCELLEVLKVHNDDNQKFREEVKVALAAMSARREAEKRSTQHGIEFEDAVYEFVCREAQHCGDVATATGASTGLIKNCKVGDCVVELGPECMASGAKIVVEAKEKAGVGLSAARVEIEQARKNRAAQFGLFVYSQKTAPPELDPFARLGDDVFVVWDPEDPLTDVYLKAGLVTARALCIRTGEQRESHDADFEAIDKAILEIEKRSERLEEIATWTGNIRRDAEKIEDRVNKSRRSLERQIENLREHLDDVRAL